MIYLYRPYFYIKTTTKAKMKAKYTPQYSLPVRILSLAVLLSLSLNTSYSLADNLRTVRTAEVFPGPRSAKVIFHDPADFNDLDENLPGDVYRERQEANIKYLFRIINIGSNIREGAAVFNLGSGTNPLSPFGGYDVVNFDAEFPAAPDDSPEFLSASYATETGAKFENLEITEIQRTCSVAIWYDLSYFIRKYADLMKIWRYDGTEQISDTQYEEECERAFKECLKHTWNITEGGGYFVIAGRIFSEEGEEEDYPEDLPGAIYEEALGLGFNISEVHIIGNTLEDAVAIVLRKGFQQEPAGEQEPERQDEQLEGAA